MIKKLICFLWGHKTVHKGYTGRTMSVDNGFVKSDVALYKWERSAFCTRCGKTIESGREGGQ